MPMPGTLRSSWSSSLQPVFSSTTGTSRLIARTTSAANRRFSGVSGNDGRK